jgi:RNA polymerase sigma-70 factor, ECF subfamily
MVLSDNEIWENIKTGNKKSFELLFNRYYDTLCLYASGIIKDYETSEEIAGQVYLKIWQSRDHIQINYGIKPYLFRCIFNACSDYLEQNRTLKQHSFVEIDNRILDIIGTNEDYIFNYIDGVEVEKKILGAIEQLPKHCREIFYLSRFELLTYSQISERLNISVNTVKTQICRAMDSLRKQLHKYLV